MSEHVLSVTKALDNTFVEVKVLKQTSDVNPESALSTILESARKIIIGALRKRNCIKFSITCDGLFQVSINNYMFIKLFMKIDIFP